MLDVLAIGVGGMLNLMAEIDMSAEGIWVPCVYRAHNKVKNRRGSISSDFAYYVESILS